MSKIEHSEFDASQINELIKSAISYGGDYGGPYFIDYDLPKIIDAMREIQRHVLPEYEIVIEGHYPLFAQREEK